MHFQSAYKQYQPLFITKQSSKIVINIKEYPFNPSYPWSFWVHGSINGN